MPKYPYRSLGTWFDRLFRNSLNDNFKDIESDIKEKDAESISRDNLIQKQIDQLVVSGDSSPAAAQAQVDVEGVVYDTLKDRIDAEQVKIGVLTENKVNKSDVYINVKDFGAIGDGIADDTLAIQNAINSAKNLPSFAQETTGKVVYFPFGEYLITQTLDMTNNAGVSLLGDGKTKSSLVKSSSLVNLIDINGNNYRGSIEKLRITGQVGELNGVAFNIQGSGNQIDIVDCWINNFQYGIKANPCADCNVSRNTFEYVATPIYLIGSYDFNINENMFYNCGHVSAGAGEFEPSYWLVNCRRINFYKNLIISDTHMSAQSNGIIVIDNCSSVIFEGNVEYEFLTQVGNNLVINNSTIIKVIKNIFGKHYFSAIKLTGTNSKLDISENSFYGTKNAPYPSISMTGSVFNGIGLRNNTFDADLNNYDVIADLGTNFLYTSNILKKGVFIDPSVTNVVEGQNMTIV